MMSQEQHLPSVPPSPVEKDHKYLSRGAAQPLRLQVLEFDSRYTVRDVSPTFNSFKTQYLGPGSPRKPEKKDVTTPPIAGKARYSGVTHIPEDLPCHERYVPLVRSRSTRTLEAQNTWGPSFPSSNEVSGFDQDEDEDEDEWDMSSDTSSVYSRESDWGRENLVPDSVPR
jgi:hypothetical protein